MAAVITMTEGFPVILFIFHYGDFYNILALTMQVK